MLYFEGVLRGKRGDACCSQSDARRHDRREPPFPMLHLNPPFSNIIYTYSFCLLLYNFIIADRKKKVNKFESPFLAVRYHISHIKRKQESPSGAGRGFQKSKENGIGLFVA